jgi:hypothetical protein
MLGIILCVSLLFQLAVNTLPASAAMAVDQDEADRELIAQNMDADLQFILSETGVSIHSQAAIARRFGTLRKFQNKVKIRSK